MVIEVGPGDVLAVQNGGIVDWGIRLFEFFGGRSSVADHIVIVTHQDDMGRWMGIQGQSGGVGLADVTPYLASTSVRANHDQPKRNDAGQLNSFLASCAASLGLSYDYVGFVGDAVEDITHIHDFASIIDHLWAWPTKSGLIPGHVVCSSLAAWLYESVGWAHPSIGSERQCEPGDWWTWSDRELWSK